jgi:hypothetical protein
VTHQFGTPVRRVVVTYTTIDEGCLIKEEICRDSVIYPRGPSGTHHNLGSMRQAMRLAGTKSGAATTTGVVYPYSIAR